MLPAALDPIDAPEALGPPPSPPLDWESWIELQATLAAEDDEDGEGLDGRGAEPCEWDVR